MRYADLPTGNFFRLAALPSGKEFFKCQPWVSTTADLEKMIQFKPDTEVIVTTSRLWENGYMPRTNLPAHLVELDGLKRCSVCKMPFAEYAKPSLSRAFSEHVKTAHKPGQKKEDASQAAARIVREATEDYPSSS